LPIESGEAHLMPPIWHSCNARRELVPGISNRSAAPEAMFR